MSLKRNEFTQVTLSCDYEDGDIRMLVVNYICCYIWLLCDMHVDMYWWKW